MTTKLQLEITYPDNDIETIIKVKQGRWDMTADQLHEMFIDLLRGAGFNVELSDFEGDDCQCETCTCENPDVYCPS